MTAPRPVITLVQRVPDAAWFERQIRAWDGKFFGPRLVEDTDVVGLASHLRGNMSVNADAVLVDGPTLRAVLDGALGGYTDPQYHARGCGLRASLSNRCTCWRADAKAMLESLKEAV